MGAFTIYFFVLTGIYLVYYSIIVLMDLFGKKGKKDADMETIAVTDDDEEEQYQVVTEGKKGQFTISGPTVEDTEQENEDQETIDEEISNFSDSKPEGEDIEAEDVAENYDADGETVPDDYDPARSGFVVDDDDDFSQFFEDAKSAVEDAATPVRPSYNLGYDLAAARVALNQPINKKSKILRSVVSIS